MAGSLENAMVLSSTTDEDEKQKGSRSKREIISTLPTEKGWKIQGLMYQYQGFWYYSGGAVEGVMWMQKCFKARNEDVLLVSFPRCGTTWLKSLMFSIMNRTRYDFSAHPLLTSSPHELVPFLEFYAEQNIPFPDLDTLSSPQLYHTHIALTSLPQPVIDSQCRIVYICRNPKDVFVSIFCFLSRWNIVVPLEEAFELFCKGISVYGPFWDHVLGYWKASLASPQRILFLKYEDVKRDSLCQVKRLAEFMGFPFSSEEEGQGLIHEIMELCSFENLRNLKVNKTGAISVGNVSTGKDTFFRKGEAKSPSLSIEEEFEQFCKGVRVYGPFWDHILGYWKASLDSPKRVLFMKYEDLKRDSSFHVKELAEFIGCPFSPEEETQGLVHEIIKLCSFENLSNLKANKIGALSVRDISIRNDTFFRKGEFGDWKNHLTAEMADSLDRIIEEKFTGSGLTFSDS
uniref:Sulfotransferase n=1 Tax=Vitis vinifera TaxID=29760 RepID=F6HBC8_VITVI